MITPTSGRGLADTPSDPAGVVAAAVVARDWGPLFELWRFFAIATRATRLHSAGDLPTAHSTVFFNPPRPACAASNSGEVAPQGKASR